TAGEAGERQRVEREVELAGPEADAKTLLMRLAPVYAEHVKFYSREYELSYPEARQLADDFKQFSREEVEKMPPKDVSWRHLAAVAEKDLGAALGVWEKVKQAAREELATGARTIESVTPNADPMERARHYALREELADGWQPRNGIEHALVDMLAMTFSLWLHWTEIANTYARGFINKATKDTYTGSVEWRAPRVSTSDAVDQAHRIADGYNRQFLRTLRQLRDLRRYAPPVIVNNGGQVNVANQQMNVQPQK
ncbi:MAG TPA: hypothetical protein VGV38_12875, partial [Pyrinomonadaceae bacterium]|nr:hypothetical protein [Pyrinomonadaceae bacterium]